MLNILRFKMDVSEYAVSKQIKCQENLHLKKVILLLEEPISSSSLDSSSHIQPTLAQVVGHIDSLQSATEDIFTLQKLANNTKQGLPHPTSQADC